MVSGTGRRARPGGGFITAQNLDAAAADLTAYLRGWPGWTLEAGPEQTTMGGMPGLRYEATGTVIGDDVKSTFVFGFDGPTVYALNYQSTPEHTAEIQTGCEQVLRTFEVESPIAVGSRQSLTSPHPAGRISPRCA
jgi:hypothetical protein